MTLSKTLHAFYRTYILPFKNVDRSLTLLGGFLGVFGFFLLNTTSSYSLGSSGYLNLISYFGPALIVAGLIYWPLLYAGYSVYDSIQWRAFFFILQVISLYVFISAPALPLIQGIVAGIMFAPFWCAYHVAMVQNTTDQNRSFEVSLSLFVNTFATVAGAITSGYLLHAYSSDHAVILAMLSLTAGTLCLSAATKTEQQHKNFIGYIKECKKIARDNPYMARRIISKSLFEIPTFTIAALMHVMGLSPMEMASVLAARVIALTFLSPFIAHIAEKHRQYSYGIGLSICGVAWLILALNPALHINYFICLLLLGIGNTFEGAGLISGIYEMQKYASMMWTEFYLGIGRFIGLTCLLPLLYYNPYIYILTLAALCAVVFAFNKIWQRRYADGPIF